jgi:hypothetical protein
VLLFREWSAADFPKQPKDNDPIKRLKDLDKYEPSDPYVLGQYGTYPLQIYYGKMRRKKTV